MSDRPGDAPDALTQADGDRIAAYVDGQLSVEERQQLEQQVLGSDRLAAALYAEMNLRRALAPVEMPRARAVDPAAAQAAPARGVAPRPRRPAALRVRMLLPMAAALALLIVLPRLLSHPTQRPPVLRGAERVPVGLTPVGKLDAPPDVFTWTSDPLAERYRLRLYDSAARLLYETTTRDTSVTLAPGQVVWGGIAAGSWRVTPFAADGAERPASSQMRFSLLAP